jgi:hypothetical protein
MHFEIVGEVVGAETIASGSGIREIRRLIKRYGRGNWRKRKGEASVLFPDGSVLNAEVHWYEVSGRGKFEFKIKKILD